MWLRALPVTFVVAAASACGGTGAGRHADPPTRTNRPPAAHRAAVASHRPVTLAERSTGDLAAAAHDTSEEHT
jgi:hypothetical protein